MQAPRRTGSVGRDTPPSTTRCQDRRALGHARRYGEEGLDFYTAFHHVPPTTAINFYSSLVFGQSNNLVWHEIIEAPDDEAKTALSTSPEWRARARDSWEQMYPQSLLRLPERGAPPGNRSRAVAPLGVTLGDYIEGRTDDPHPSDALADWVLRQWFRLDR